MKKSYAIVLTLTMALSLTACGNPSTGSANSAATTSAAVSSSASPAASATSSAAASTDAASTTTPSTGDGSLVVDMIGTASSLGSLSSYVDAFTMTYHFEDGKISGITEEITLQDAASDEATISALQASLASQGDVSVDGNVVTVSLSDLGMYSGMSKDDVKTALQSSGYQFTEG